MPHAISRRSSPQLVRVRARRARRCCTSSCATASCRVLRRKRPGPSGPCRSPSSAGLSHLDSFDYKPELAKFHGQTLQHRASRPTSSSARSACSARRLGVPPARPERPVGLRPLSRTSPAVADELTVIRSMVAETAEPHPGPLQANSGFRLNGFPAMGAWLSLRAGQRDRRPAGVRRPARRPRRAERRRRQLDERLPAGPAPGRRLPRAAARRSPTCSPAGRSARRGAERAGAFLEQAERAATSDEAAATTPWRPGSAATSWPRGCSSAVPRGRGPRRRAGDDPRALRPRSRRDGATSAAAACSPGGCSSAACGSCSSSRGGPIGQPRDRLGRPRERHARTTAPEAVRIDRPSPPCSAT